jgi:Peptidase family M23
MQRMKKVFLVAQVLLLFASTSSAQRLIEIRSEKDAAGNYQFYCTNNAYCPYILEVNFPVLANLKSDHEIPFRTMVKPGGNKLFKLTRINAGEIEKFNYRISYARGCINPQINPDFTYLLPIAPGKMAQVYELESSTSSSSTAIGLKEWYAIRIRMNPGDTIYAARRGTVTDVQDNSGLNDSGVASTSVENYVEINHRDCSFGHYGVLRKNSALVKPGQWVEAGDPIGLVGGDKFGRGSDVKFSVYYNREEDSSARTETNRNYVNWVYITPAFWTQPNGKTKLKNGAKYAGEFSESVITQEMSKAELTKWKAKHKPGSSTHKS